jgi:hypothetical protein
MALKHWMSWEGGVDLVASTSPRSSSPNVIIHVARMVHTPVGSAKSGMLFWQPDPGAAPEAFCFVTTDSKVGAYFGANIFAGTPFENAPHVLGDITIDVHPDDAVARVEIPGLIFETRLSGLNHAALIQRPPSPAAPFFQQGLEASAQTATLKLNGGPVEIHVPPSGITGGPAAVFSPCGIYARE